MRKKHLNKKELSSSGTISRLEDITNRKNRKRRKRVLIKSRFAAKFFSKRPMQSQKAYEKEVPNLSEESKNIDLPLDFSKESILKRMEIRSKNISKMNKQEKEAFEDIIKDGRNIDSFSFEIEMKRLGLDLE